MPKSDSESSRIELYALTELIEHNSTEEDSFMAENKIKQNLMSKLQELKEKLRFNKKEYLNPSSLELKGTKSPTSFSQINLIKTFLIEARK